MNEHGKRVVAAQERVDAYRREGAAGQLANALEQLATALLKEADLLAVAETLEEAAEIWSDLRVPDRVGSCLLLATATRRLAGDLEGARHNVDAATQMALPRNISNGFKVEWCEQELDKGDSQAAYEGFTRLLENLASELDTLQKAHLFQRRAAAAMAGERFLEAGEDLLEASTLFTRQGAHQDAEAAALAAASALVTVDPQAAERIVSELSRSVPADGPSAVRRGLVGGKVAMQLHDGMTALKRFDQARQGALDTLDPLSYLSAAVLASQTAENMQDDETAYARLATAWASLTDLMDPDSAATMVRPELQGLQERLGTERFANAKQRYEEKRRSLRKR